MQCISAYEVSVTSDDIQYKQPYLDEQVLLGGGGPIDSEIVDNLGSDFSMCCP